MSKHYFSYAITRLPYCCGVYEVGNFHLNTVESSTLEKWPNRHYQYDSVEDAYKAALEKILGEYPNFCIQFWFYKPSDYNGEYEGEEYVENGFRELVKTHPNCVELAEYVNKNSGNMINGFMINNNTSQIKSDVYEEEEEDSDNY